ncbi:MAG: FIG01964566: Predicted membrane protein, hemolysin III homolog, partial [uncultured Nocardioidaceae bacterium]
VDTPCCLRPGQGSAAGTAARRPALRGHRGRQAPAAGLAAPGHLTADRRRRHRSRRAVTDPDGPPGQCGVHRDGRPALHGVRDLPPRPLGPEGLGLPAPLRPREHLPADRRQLHPVHAPHARGTLACGAALDRLGGGTARRRVPRLLDRRPALAVHPGVHGAGMGGAVLQRRVRRGRQWRGLRARRDRRGALHPRRDRLRTAAAGPVPLVVRLPRGVPRPHRARLRRALRRRLAGDLLAAL